MDWIDRTIRDFRTTLTALRGRLQALETSNVGKQMRLDAISSSLATRVQCEAKLIERIDALVDGYAEIERRQKLIDDYWQSAAPYDEPSMHKARGTFAWAGESKVINSDPLSKPFEECDMIELIAAFNNYNERIFHTLSNFSDPEKTHSRQLAGLCKLRDEAYTWILTRKRDGKE